MKEMQRPIQGFSVSPAVNNNIRDDVVFTDNHLEGPSDTSSSGSSSSSCSDSSSESDSDEDSQADLRHHSEHTNPEEESQCGDVYSFKDVQRNPLPSLETKKTASVKVKLNCGRKRNFRDVHKQKKDRKVGSDKVECEQCGKKIMKWNLLRHKRDVHNYATVKCDQCGKQVKEHVLERHIQDTHMPKVKCSFCGKEYAESYLKVHIDTVHKGNVTVKCGQCGEQVKSLWRHIRDVHKPKVKCSFCGKLFSERPLKVHIDKVHKGKSRNRCQISQCEELGKEKRKDYLHKQVGLIQKGTKSKVKCDLCQKEILKRNLSRHKKNHRSEFIEALIV